MSIEKQVTRLVATARTEQIIERLDRIADEINAGPRRKQHIVTSRGEFLDGFKNSAEAGDWKKHRAELGTERRLLTSEWERLTDGDESRDS
jgi:hypothetical protein